MTLDEALGRLSGRVLVAMDFDGTLAEIGPEPDRAAAVPGALEVLTLLAARPDTEVAVVSGRSMVDLDRLVPIPGVILVGEHGAAPQGHDPPTPEGFGEVLALLERAAALHPGARVEVKRASLVVHTRGLERSGEEEVLAAARAALLSIGHANFHSGKHIVDVGFVDISKGVVLERLRETLGCEVVVFAGDDTTDETVFERLRPGDLGVKVGPGPTAAGHRVDTPADVVALLERLAHRAVRSGYDTVAPR